MQKYQAVKPKGNYMAINLHIYTLAAVLSCMFAVLAQKKMPVQCSPLPLKGADKQQKKKYITFILPAVCSAMPFLLLSSFRYDVGTDYFFTYRPMYDLLAKGWNIKYSVNNVGRWVLFDVIYRLGGGHVWFFLITSAIIICLFFFVFYKQSALPAVSVALFFLTEAFFTSMNGVMQFVGLAFVFAGFIFVEKQCFWKYAIFVLAGAFFHPSVIIFLPLYFFSKVKINPLISVGAVAALSFFNKPLTDFLTFAVSKTPYGSYAGSVFQETQRFYWARAFVYALIICVALYCYNKNDNSSKPVYRFYFYTLLLALYLSVNRNIIPLVDRVLWSLEIVQLLLIPMLIKSVPDKKIKAAIAVGLLGAWAIVCYTEIKLWGHHEVLPYRFVFFSHIIFT